jgi:LCP family protein required for cell wall assembly
MTAPRLAPLAALMSLLVPGLGQAVMGRRRRAALVAIPALGVGVALIILAAAIVSDPTAALDLVPTPDVLPALLAAEAVLLAYHLAAILDAEHLALAARPVRGWRRVPAALMLAGLLLAAVGVHGSIGWLESQVAQSAGVVLSPDDGSGAALIPEPSWAPEASDEPVETASPTTSPVSTPSVTATSSGGASASPATASPSAEPTASPTPKPTPKPSAVPAWAADGRLDLLLVGSDAGPDRWSLRTDTMIVLSVDVKTARAALFGIPRNLIGVPLPPESAAAVRDGRFPGLLNALYVYAMGHPKQFPGGDTRGWRAVSGAVQELLGVRLDGIVAVDLAGVVSLVNELGGLWIDIPSPLVDDNYPLEDGSGWIHLSLRPGCQHLDGRMALAYARSRHQDSDYGRMRRQQTVLLALRRELDPVALLPKVPALLSIARDNLWTTLSRADLRSLAKLAERVDVRRVARVLFVPPTYAETLTDPEIARIRSVTRSIFEQPLPPADTSLAAGHCP